MNSANDAQTSISPILRPLFDILDTFGHNYSVVSNEKYAELLGQTVRAMEERLSALRLERALLFERIDKLDESIQKAEADMQSVNAIWNRTPFREHEIGNTKPLSSEKSFTAAIEYVLKALGTKMSPTEIRDKMAEWGFDIKGYKSDVVASIHTTLKRLAKNGRITPYQEGPRRTVWEWNKESNTRTA
jgi:hypothetical protein